MSVINVSIVLYNHNLKDIKPLLDSLDANSDFIEKIYLIDNSPQANSDFERLGDKYLYLHTGKNLGYGKGHNIAIKKTLAADLNYHLVLNPDVIFKSGTLEDLINFMSTNTSVGGLSPLLYNKDEIQEIRALPHFIYAILRRFVSLKIANLIFNKQVLHLGERSKVNTPYISGAFILLRMNVVKKIGLFDPMFFMYFEDIDFSRRLAEVSDLYYIKTTTKVYHQWQRASYSNFKLMKHHIASAIKYFNKWGWFFDKTRKSLNLKSRKANSGV